MVDTSWPIARAIFRRVIHHSGRRSASSRMTSRWHKLWHGRWAWKGARHLAPFPIGQAAPDLNDGDWSELDEGVVAQISCCQAPWPCLPCCSCPAHVCSAVKSVSKKFLLKATVILFFCPFPVQPSKEKGKQRSDNPQIVIGATYCQNNFASSWNYKIVLYVKYIYNLHLQKN